MEPYISQSFMFSKTAKDSWDGVCGFPIFLKENYVGIYKNQLEIRKSQQGDANVGNHYQVLKDTWVEMSHYQPHSTSDEFERTYSTSTFP